MKIMKANEVPFDELQQVGISEEAFLNLPKEAIDRMMTGRTSPLLQMQWTKKDGTLVPFLGKLALMRDADGKVHLNVIPRIEKQEMVQQLAAAKGITPEDFKKMDKGEILVKEVGRERQYFQLDRTTNSVVSIKEADIRVPNSVGDVTLGEKQKDRIREGKPLELEVGNTKVTVGVDLNDVTGCRVIKGDLNQWKQDKLIEWDRNTLGVAGYWRCSENNWQLQQVREQQQGRNTVREKTFSQRYAEEHAVKAEEGRSYGLKR